MKLEDGEYMPLVWDGQPDAFYIKGHVDTKTGLAVLAEEDVIGDKIGQGVQKYGRWSTEGDCEQPHTLREYLNPGRGRFKITVFGIGIFAKKEVK